MKNKSNKKIFIYFAVFGLISLVIFYFNLNRYYLSYNLALSFIPYLLTENIVRNKDRKAINIFLALIALLFYPNAIYMFTDFIHIDTSEYYKWVEYKDIIYNLNYVNWVKLGCDVSAIFLSLTLSYESFENFSEIIGIKNFLIKVLMLVPLSLITGFAIYLGRILRLNSWNVITSVREIIQVAKNIVTPEILGLVLTFSGIHFILILIFLTMSIRK